MELAPIPQVLEEDGEVSVASELLPIFYLNFSLRRFCGGHLSDAGEYRDLYKAESVGHSGR